MFGLLCLGKIVKVSLYYLEFSLCSQINILIALVLLNFKYVLMAAWLVWPGQGFRQFRQVANNGYSQNILVTFTILRTV